VLVSSGLTAEYRWAVGVNVKGDSVCIEAKPAPVARDDDFRLTEQLSMNDFDLQQPGAAWSSQEVSR